MSSYYSIVELLQHAVKYAVIARQCCKVHIAMYIAMEVLQHCRAITAYFTALSRYYSIPNAVNYAVNYAVIPRRGRKDLDHGVNHGVFLL